MNYNYYQQPYQNYYPQQNYNQFNQQFVYNYQNANNFPQNNFYNQIPINYQNIVEKKEENIENNSEEENKLDKCKICKEKSFLIKFMQSLFFLYDKKILPLKYKYEN